MNINYIEHLLVKAVVRPCSVTHQNDLLLNVEFMMFVRSFFLAWTAAIPLLQKPRKCIILQSNQLKN